jgi:hypothetical protein
LPATLLRRTDHTADLYVEGNRDISVTNGDSIKLPLRVEPQSLLTIENWAGNSMISSEKHQIESSEFDYMMAPKTGDTRVVFKLTDRFSNTATADAFINRKDLPLQQIIRPEYSTVISKKQTAAYLALLKNRADENQLKLISGSGVDKKEFKKADDLLVFLKTEASDKNIKPEDIDKLALKVAVMDNVLTQAAVDITANYADGELKKILTGLDIYQADLKTWSDLQRYISEMSGEKITPQDLNYLTSIILSDVDPAIAVIREKILTFSENDKAGSVLRDAVNATDLKKINPRGKWLNSFFSEAVNHGLTPEKLSEMFVIISTMPDTKYEQFTASLLENSEEPLKTSIKSIDLNKEKLKSPKDLLVYLITSKDQLKYPEDSVFKSIANLIASQNIPAGTIKSQQEKNEGNCLWILWVIIGASIALFFIIYTRRKKKGEK